MNRKNIIVIGASAGGVSALQAIVSALPPDFPGSLFVVMHVSALSPSSLPQILSSTGPLNAIHPRDGQPIAQGVIYVAPPDYHLLIETGKVLVRKGPKENRFRPSIDALFRSAAYVYGPRTVGIVMSGALNDGASGLWSVKRMGGTTVVQDPAEAEHPEMPLNALEYVDVDYTLSAWDIGLLVKRVVSENTLLGA